MVEMRVFRVGMSRTAFDSTEVLAAIEAIVTMAMISVVFNWMTHRTDHFREPIDEETTSATAIGVMLAALNSIILISGILSQLR